MSKARRLLTNFSKGELSPLIEGRPDLAAYFEGGRKIENYLLLRQGGLERRPGLRFVVECKDSNRDTILLPFEPDTDNNYVLEFGHRYIRFIKDKAQIVDASDLVANGTFDTDLADWVKTISGSGNVVWNNGKARFTKGAAFGTAVLRQGVTVLAGKSYTLRFTIVNTGGPFGGGLALQLLVGSTLGGSDLLVVGVTTGSYAFQIISPTTLISIKLASDDILDPHPLPPGQADWDDVELRSNDVAIEIVSPYTEARLREIHYTESVDVLFLFNQLVQQQLLSRISDISWDISPMQYNPSPSFEDDTDISGGTATLTPSATTGQSVIFTASAAVFLNADVGRQIIFGASRGIISAFGASAGDTATPNDHVRVDIIDAFPDTNPIAAGSWLLRLSPQTTLDPDKKGPAGSFVGLVAGVAAFRSTDVNKFIIIYGGLVRITFFASATSITGILESEMVGTSDTNPAAAPAGAWTLETASWSVDNGFPGTGEFFQGRLGQASTPKQKTSFWLSRNDDFTNYGIGAAASDALDYTIAARTLSQIMWMADNIDLFLGAGGSEHRVIAGRENEPLGGDVIPNVSRITQHGSAAIQPTVISRRIIFVDRSRRLIFAISFSLEEDGFDALEVTGPSEHITKSGIRLGPVAYQKRLHPRLYWVREDGQLIVLTYYHHEKVVGFSRVVTNGTFEAVCAIPKAVGSDQVYAIVKRTINGQIKRYIELFEENASELDGRLWTSCQTDCSKVYALGGVATTVLTGLGHLEGETVDVITDGAYRGTKVVTNAEVTLTEEATLTAEIGLHYDSEGQTMRPAVEGQMVEGLPRNWIKLWMRLFETMGGQINGQDIEYTPTGLGELALFTGDKDVSAEGESSLDGAITFKQNLPYPMTILAVYGECEFGDHG